MIEACPLDYLVNQKKRIMKSIITYALEVLLNPDRTHKDDTIQSNAIKIAAKMRDASVVKEKSDYKDLIHNTFIKIMMEDKNDKNRL